MENLILRTLIKEISSELLGKNVESVSGFPPSSLLVELKRERKESKLSLVISLDPRFPALFTVSEGLAGASAGETETWSGNLRETFSEVLADALPEGFVRTMSTSLRGATITGIEQLGRDRVVGVSFSRSRKSVDAVLWMELFGRRPNAVLVRPPEDTIVACSRQGITSAAGTLLRPGETYSLPSEEKKIGAEVLSAETIRTIVEDSPPEKLGSRLSSAIKGLSPQAAAVIVEEAAVPKASPDVQNLLGRLKEALLTGDERLRPAVRTAVHSPAGRLLASGDATPRVPRDSRDEHAGVKDFDLVLFPFGADRSGKRKTFATRDFDTASDAVRFVFFHLCRWYSTLSAAKIRKHARLLLERLARLRVSLQSDMAAAEKSGDHRRMGELILANIKTVERGNSTLEATDIHGDGSATIRIELDPSLSPSQNAKRYFNRARKAERALERVRKRLATVERAAETVAEFADSIPEKVDFSEADMLARKLSRIVDRLRAQRTMDVRPVAPGFTWSGKTKRGGSLRDVTAERKPGAPGEIAEKRRRDGARRQPSASEPAAAFNPRLFETSDGFTVVVGRNNKENDYVTYRVARPEDLWFHASGMAGSHVVLKRKGKSAPSRRAIEEAASLAAYFSKGRTSSAVPVIYTKRKYVHKPRGSRPGVATYGREKFLMVKPVKPRRAS